MTIPETRVCCSEQLDFGNRLPLEDVVVVTTLLDLVLANLPDPEVNTEEKDKSGGGEVESVS